MKTLKINKFSVLISIILIISGAARAEFIMTIGGDLNLGQSGAEPSANFTVKNGQRFNWANLFSGVEPLLIGQLNFFNLETVLTDGSTALSKNGGKYVFRSHLEGLRYAKKIGLNWMSLANNHAGDYGDLGMMETIKSLELLQSDQSPIFYHGIARAQEKEKLLHPTILDLQSTTEGQVRIAFASITLVRNSPMDINHGRAGVIYYENESDMQSLLENFRNVQADFKVLSIHYGTEKQLSLNDGQLSRYHQYMQEGDIDLIIGHHPHRVRPVEQFDLGGKKRIIYYSLGNYLMLGAENLNGQSLGHNYGLMGRLYLERTAGNQLSVKQMEAIPLMGMHARVYPLEGTEAADHIKFLNRLSQQELGKTATIWELSPNGWGQVCLRNCETIPNPF